MRLDRNHAALALTAHARARAYRAMRDGRGSDRYLEVRARFLASLGRLAAFEQASTYVLQCRYDTQLAAYVDELTREFFTLRQVIGRHGIEPRPIDESGWRRLDYFATQIGRLEGVADALVLSGRNVRLYPLPPLPWLKLT